MDTYDQQIGRNLRRFRERLTESDKSDFALQMRLQGWAWTEETVDAIERGERTLLRAESVDLMGALGYSQGFITMRTDAESESEIAEMLFIRADSTLREALEWWFNVESRYRASSLPVPRSVEDVIAEGRGVFADPDAVFGTPADDDQSMTLADWEDLPVRPRHPLDAIGVDVPWTSEQIEMQLDHDLRMASHAVRYATVAWLRAEVKTDAERRTPERAADAVRKDNKSWPAVRLKSP